MKKEKINLFLLVAIFISFVAIGVSIFTYYQTPKNIENYVRAHKEELRGEKGEQGEQGETGPMGLSGTSSSSGSVNCTSRVGIGGTVFTDCY